MQSLVWKSNTTYSSIWISIIQENKEAKFNLKDKYNFNKNLNNLVFHSKYLKLLIKITKMGKFNAFF